MSTISDDGRSFFLVNEKLSYIFRVGDSREELEFEDSYLLFGRCKRLRWQRNIVGKDRKSRKKLGRVPFQKKSWPWEVCGQEEWAIEKLVARELERPKLTKTRHRG